MSNIEESLLSDGERQTRALQEEQDQLAADQRALDWEQILSTEGGRRVLNEIIDYSGFQRQSFTGQTNQTIFNAGMQRVGQHVFETAGQVSADLFLQLMKEKING